MYEMSSVTIVLLANETIKCELILGQNEKLFQLQYTHN